MSRGGAACRFESRSGDQSFVNRSTCPPRGPMLPMPIGHGLPHQADTRAHAPGTDCLSLLARRLSLVRRARAVSLRACVRRGSRSVDRPALPPEASAALPLHVRHVSCRSRAPPWLARAEPLAGSLSGGVLVRRPRGHRRVVSCRTPPISNGRPRWPWWKSGDGGGSDFEERERSGCRRETPESWCRPWSQT